MAVRALAFLDGFSSIATVAESVPSRSWGASIHQTGWAAGGGSHDRRGQQRPLASGVARVRPLRRRLEARLVESAGPAALQVS